MSHEQHIPIQIDHRPYQAPRTPMTGAELKAFAQPPIGPDYDLWLVVPGPADDDKIDDTHAVDLKPGMHFYSAPKTINPGDYHAPA